MGQALLASKKGLGVISLKFNVKCPITKGDDLRSVPIKHNGCGRGSTKVI